LALLNLHKKAVNLQIEIKLGLVTGFCRFDFDFDFHSAESCKTTLVETVIEMRVQLLMFNLK